MGNRQEAHLRQRLALHSTLAALHMLGGRATAREVWRVIGGTKEGDKLLGEFVRRTFLALDVLQTMGLVATIDLVTIGKSGCPLDSAHTHKYLLLEKGYDYAVENGLDVKRR